MFSLLQRSISWKWSLHKGVICCSPKRGRFLWKIPQTVSVVKNHPSAVYIRGLSTSGQTKHPVRVMQEILPSGIWTIQCTAKCIMVDSDPIESYALTCKMPRSGKLPRLSYKVKRITPPGLLICRPGVSVVHNKPKTCPPGWRMDGWTDKRHSNHFTTSAYVMFYKNLIVISQTTPTNVLDAPSVLFHTTNWKFYIEAKINLSLGLISHLSGWGKWRIQDLAKEGRRALHIKSQRFFANKGARGACAPWIRAWAYTAARFKLVYQQRRLGGTIILYIREARHDAHKRQKGKCRLGINLLRTTL
jgi:hypothetical protein